MTKKTGTIIVLVILLILLTVAKFKGIIGGEDALLVKTDAGTLGCLKMLAALFE